MTNVQSIPVDSLVNASDSTLKEIEPVTKNRTEG